MKLKLDHIGIVGRDMAPLLTWAKDLGFAPTEPKPLFAATDETGHRAALGQDSAHIVLEQGYIELSAVRDLERNAHLGPYLRRREGLLILAFEVTDIADSLERCAAYSPSPIQQASREITYGERHGWAHFDWFMLAPQASPDGLVCFVNPKNKELIYQSAVTSHPNGVTALTGIDIFADLDTQQRYASMGAACEAGVTFISTPKLVSGSKDEAPAMVGFEVRGSPPALPDNWRQETGENTVVLRQPDSPWPYVRFRQS